MAKMLTQIDGTQNGAALIDALTTVLRNVTKEETVQYVLALLDDVVSSEPLPFRASFAPSIWRAGRFSTASAAFRFHDCCAHECRRPVC